MARRHELSSMMCPLEGFRTDGLRYPYCARYIWKYASSSNCRILKGGPPVVLCTYGTVQCVKQLGAEYYVSLKYSFFLHLYGQSKQKIKFNHFTIACVVPLPSQLQMQYVIFKPDNLILYDMDFQHANLFTQISFISDRMPTRHNLSAWQGHSTIVYRLIEITRWAT